MSPRTRAQLGLVSATLVLVTCVSILLHGRENLRPQDRGTVAQAVQPQVERTDMLAMNSTPHVLPR